MAIEEEDIELQLRCPCCGNRDRFKVIARVYVMVRGSDYTDIVEKDDDFDYDSESSCTCAACTYVSRLGEFRLHRQIDQDAIDTCRLDFVRNVVVVGTQVVSIHGEVAHGDDDREWDTGPNARGEVIGIWPEQEACYSVAFPNHHNVSVFLTLAELADPSQYLFADPGERI